MRPLLLLLLVILLGCGCWLLFREGRERGGQPERAVHSQERAAGRAAEERPGARSRTTAAAGQTGPRFVHRPEQLKNFILAGVEGKDVGLGQALQLLKEAYLDACHHSGEQALPVKFTVRDDPGCRISFKLAHLPFRGCLDYLAALGGLRVRENGTEFELFRSEDTRMGEFKSQRVGLFDALLPGAGGLEEKLRAAGLLRDPASKVTVAADGIAISGSERDLAAVRAWAAMAPAAEVKMDVSARLVSMPEAVDAPQGAVSNREFLAWLKEVQVRQGYQLDPLPAVRLAEGGQGSAEMPPGFEGPRMHGFTAQRMGLRLVGGVESGGERSTQVLTEAETVVEDLGVSNGRHYYRTYSVTGASGPDAIDLTPETGGSSVAAQPKFPAANAAPGKDGFVVSPYSGQLLDVRGVPPGSLIREPGSPVAEQKLFWVR